MTFSTPTIRDTEQRPDLPSDFGWSYGAIDCDDPLLVEHEGGTTACRRLIREFSSAAAAERWARGHECQR